MQYLKTYLFYGCVALGALFLLVVISVGLYARGLYPGYVLLFIFGIYYGWMLFAYLHYRQGRQDEFLHLLTTAVEAELPLGPALWSYLKDRPRSLQREVLVAMLLFFVFPGYYWIWHRRHGFDAKVATLASYLDMGVSLPAALRAVRGIVSRDTLLAVTIGESTGQMLPALRGVTQNRLATIWLQVIVRAVYPVMIIAFTFGVVGFWVNFIEPKIQRISKDFHMPMPEASIRLVEAWGLIEDNADDLAEGFLIAVAVVVLIAASPFLRWYLPLVSRLQRTYVRARVLKMLSLLVAAGKPIPESLKLLADSGQFALIVRWHLRRAQRLAVNGMPLAECLRRRSLVTGRMVPLLTAAQRVQNLPWALAALGDTLAGRTMRTVERISLALNPIIVTVLGCMVAFVVLGMYMPLVDLLIQVEQQ
jgi:type II secretory pathway component PulF